MIRFEISQLIRISGAVIVGLGFLALLISFVLYKNNSVHFRWMLALSISLTVSGFGIIALVQAGKSWKWKIRSRKKKPSKKCLECGAEIPELANSCVKCGACISPDVVKCHNCGDDVSTYKKECEQCKAPNIQFDVKGHFFCPRRDKDNLSSPKGDNPTHFANSIKGTPPLYLIQYNKFVRIKMKGI